MNRYNSQEFCIKAGVQALHFAAFPSLCAQGAQPSAAKLESQMGRKGLNQFRGEKKAYPELLLQSEHKKQQAHTGEQEARGDFISLPCSRTEPSSETTPVKSDEQENEEQEESFPKAVQNRLLTAGIVTLGLSQSVAGL